MRTLEKPKPSELIDTRMKIFLKRRLIDILDHLPQDKDNPHTQRNQQALSKLKEDHYGLCEDCGHAISIDRILADPAVERCECCEHGINCPTDHPTNPNAAFVFPPIALHN